MPRSIAEQKKFQPAKFISINLYVYVGVPREEQGVCSCALSSWWSGYTKKTCSDRHVRKFWTEFLGCFLHLNVRYEIHASLCTCGPRGSLGDLARPMECTKSPVMERGAGWALPFQHSRIILLDFVVWCSGPGCFLTTTLSVCGSHLYSHLWVGIVFGQIGMFIDKWTNHLFK